MKRIFAVISFVLITAGSAFALSDSEYLRMRRNNVAFARADKILSNVWTNLKRSLPKNVFAQLQKEQREWIASGRDEEAEEYIEQGYSRAEAYTMATKDRAELLPELAKSLSGKKPAPSRPRPEPEKKPEIKPEKQPVKRQPKIPDPVPEPEPEPEPVPEDDDSESQAVTDPEGEYESTECFMTVKIIDRSSMEAEVSIARWKDEVNWKASGWIDDDVLVLSDSQYSTCQATITFKGKSAKVSVTDSGDWAKITAEDFVIAGTYKKH